MTSYLKIFVLIDFHFQDAIFPFNRAAPYGMTSAVPRSKAERARGARSVPSLSTLARTLRCRASESEVSGGLRDGAKDLTRRNSFQLPFKRYPIKNFGEQPGGQI